MKTKILTTLIFIFISVVTLFAQQKNNEKVNMDNDLVIVWTSDDPYVAERVALMYTHAAKLNNWFDNVTLIVWGPSAKLIAENIKLQEKVKQMIADGVIVEACSACSDAYGTTKILQELGYNPKPMGVPLTTYLKSGANILTY